MLDDVIQKIFHPNGDYSVTNHSVVYTARSVVVVPVYPPTKHPMESSYSNPIMLNKVRTHEQENTGTPIRITDFITLG